MQNNPTPYKESNTKKCPLCAEEIQVEAQVCRFCGARFLVERVGYCTFCHAKRKANEAGSCSVCENSLTDIHVESELIRVDDLKRTQPAQPESILPKGRKTHSRVGRVLGILVLFAVAIVITLILYKPTFLSSMLTLLKLPTNLPFSLGESANIIKPHPTLTPLAMAEEVTFDTISSYPIDQDVIIVGQLVLPDRVRFDEVCGVFLRNPMKYYERITIFLFIPLAENTPLPNQMARLPRQYSASDFEVRLDNGNYVGNYETVRITGSTCETTEGDIAICDITKIESVQLPASTSTTTLMNILTPSPAIVDNPETPLPTVVEAIPASGTGTATGQILWNGQGVADVTVKLCTKWVIFLGCQTTEYQAITDTDGRYTISKLPAGVYDFATLSPGEKNEAGQYDLKVTVVAGRTVTIRDTNIIKDDLRLTSPENDATVRTNTPTLEWEAYPGATYYKVVVLSHDLTFDFLTKYVVDSENVSSPQYIFKKNLPSGKYSWSIYAYNAEGIEISASRSDSNIGGQSYYFIVAP